ncbi:peptidoglycan-associated lipoprotein Pal [Sphingomonas melonis]|uniref:peptidoglycan-associated lipoprotein Pal n=1 Tax=Sphingomonas melonis TaxID=152682 RepID=UPI001C8B70E4|nr:peptidoglycan-associated lipoprotein Pal [Sphingomonas melonis]MBX8844510.1 peptidoglycan-associated lipoprotein Pal [Sphingomonas melonis]MBX8852389.1 peptidoglycan-associated lipoprotein Pal [Sphingomonas melonis]MBX8897852.1 peptidoglycan-associated lipoprotein Pal [Sphingomonas melonis]
MRYAVRTAVVLGAVLASGCAHKRVPSGAMPPVQNDGSQSLGDQGPSGAEAAGARLQADLAREAGSDRVFFALDSSSLDEASRQTLQRQAAWLRAHPDVSFTIEGHCDERGTREYNIALGDRRAKAAADYLIGQGISPARITMISFGKERPEALGSDEASWARNRRAVSIVVAPNG